MPEYTISLKRPDGSLEPKWTLEAESVERAAVRHLQTPPGQVIGAYPERLTGTPGLSGWFRPFREMRDAGHATSCGEDFHVG